MSSLRRRIFGVSSTPSPSSSGVSTPAVVDQLGEDLAVVPSKQLHKLAEKAKRPKGTKRRNAWIFGLGGVFGVVVAAFFAGQQDMLDLKALAELNLDSILDVLPAGLVKDAQDLQVGAFHHSSRPRCYYFEFSVLLCSVPIFAGAIISTRLLRLLRVLRLYTWRMV